MWKLMMIIVGDHVQPDITFFGEQLTDEFDRSLAHDRDKVDLLLVIGTSLKVSPVADILCEWSPFLHERIINSWIKHQLIFRILYLKYVKTCFLSFGSIQTNVADPDKQNTCSTYQS